MQFGFRADHSTVHPLTLVLNHISKALDSKKHSIAIFCDLSKAFDCVNHSLLLKKLKSLGVGGRAVEWFASYLSNRQQLVSVDNCISSLLPILYGVPQGSILGPLLFLVYINNLPNISNLSTYLFADDTTLLASHEDFEILIDRVQTEFRKICEFFRQHGLALNAKKTNFMIFSNSPVIRNTKIDLFINNNNQDQNEFNLISPIEQILPNSSDPVVKFLGVLIDSELTFKYHIAHVEKQIAKGLYFMRTARNFFSKHCLLSIYYTMIHSYLTYALPIWSCSSDQFLKKILTKQKMAVRIIENSKFNAHTEPLFKANNILPLPKLVLYFNLNLIHNYHYKFLPKAFNNYWPTNRELRGNNEFLPDLRNDFDLNVMFCRLKNTERFPYINLPKIWNKFNSEVPQISIIRDKSKFKFKLKEHLLTQLNGNYTCNRLFCHSCSANPQ